MLLTVSGRQTGVTEAERRLDESRDRKEQAEAEYREVQAGRNELRAELQGSQHAVDDARCVSPHRHVSLERTKDYAFLPAETDFFGVLSPQADWTAHRAWNVAVD